MNVIIKHNATTFGIAIGVLSILVTTIIYATDLSLFVNPWIGLITIALQITIGIILVSKTKKELGNAISFKEGFTVYFLAAVIGVVLSTLFSIILFNYIDPSIKDTLRDVSIQFTRDMMAKFNAPESSVNEAVEKMKTTDNYSPGNLLFGMLTSFVICAVFAAILGLIFKNKSSYRE